MTDKPFDFICTNLTPEEARILRDRFDSMSEQIEKLRVALESCYPSSYIAREALYDLKEWKEQAISSQWLQDDGS